MSTSTETHADATPKFDVVDAPTETPDDTTYIVHRWVDDKGTHEKRMPTSEWAAYAKENDL